MTDHLAYDTFYNYTYTHGTNRLATATWQGKTESFSYTPTGNISQINLTTGNLYTMGYNKANRLDSVTGGDVQLAISGASYDAFGKRITKSNPGSAPILYSYDLDGHLIEEDNGGAVTDYIYMDGINVANWEPSEKHLYFINFDSRGVPQMSRDEYGLTNWAAYSDPDGLMTATVSSGQFTGPVTQNLRLPGQYFDHEDGLHYNGFRDYMPGLGRYVESDPIGLGGGLNTYSYADDNPHTFIDPSGTDIRIENAPWPHQNLSVDTPTGPYQVSFSGNPVIIGSVYVDYSEATTIVEGFHTTPGEDRLAIAYLQDIVGQRGLYGGLFDNCRTFSRQKFDEIKSFILELRAAGYNF